jgi:hypothetical protein
VSDPAATLRSVSRQRLHDWTKTVLFILAVGPPVGGLVYGLFLSAVIILKGLDKSVQFPAGILASMVLSYVIGVPVAAVAVPLFFVLQRLVKRGTAYLAALCAVLASLFLIFLNDVTRDSTFIRMGWRDYLIMLGIFGVPSAISALVCWRMTSQWHRLR